jgi:hypothetical protein
LQILWRMPHITIGTESIERADALRSC